VWAPTWSFQVWSGWCARHPTDSTWTSLHTCMCTGRQAGRQAAGSKLKSSISTSDDQVYYYNMTSILEQV
jgi:hypothetical protein